MPTKINSRTNRANSYGGGGIPNISSMTSYSDNDTEFYQYEAALVVDIILDKNHPELTHLTLNPDIHPAQSDGSKHPKGTPDLTFIGACKIRMLSSSEKSLSDNLMFAYPLDPSTHDYPLINEMVQVVNVNGNYYYTPRIKLHNNQHINADFEIKTTITGPGNPKANIVESARGSQDPYKGPELNYSYENKDLLRNKGVCGRYFWFNDKIRRLRRFEGDSVFESRFGQSIRMGAYDDNRENDTGLKDNSDYYKEFKNPNGSSTGGGNPMFLLRNRQRKVASEGFKTVRGQLVDKKDIEYEKKYYSDIVEDVNWDGSSIHITSGKTESKWKANNHFMFDVPWLIDSTAVNAPSANQAASAYQQPVSQDTANTAQSTVATKTKWKYPRLTGEQIVFVSDRLVFGARKEEIIMNSKKRFHLASDQEFTVDSHEQMVFTTNEKVVFNSPHIYLGEYDKTQEPAVLGETLIEWLFKLCKWLEAHTHHYNHTHPVSHSCGNSNPNKTQVPVQIQELMDHAKQLPIVLSKRVFMVGGGHEPGQDGKKVENLENSKNGKIDKTPGEWKIADPGSFNGSLKG